jgi:hypothetical protein
MSRPINPALIISTGPPLLTHEASALAEPEAIEIRAATLATLNPMLPMATFLMIPPVTLSCFIGARERTLDGDCAGTGPESTWGGRLQLCCRSDAR